MKSGMTRYDWAKRDMSYWYGEHLTDDQLQIAIKRRFAKMVTDGSGATVYVKNGKLVVYKRRIVRNLP